MQRHLKKMLLESDARGFSLIEVIVVVAIMAIVLAISIPNFQVWQDHSRVNRDARVILGAMQRARMEAVKRNEFVTVLFTNNAAVTPNYIAFFDRNANRVQDAGEQIFFSDNFRYANHTAAFGPLTSAIFNGRGLPSTSSVSTGFVVGSVTVTNPANDYSKVINVSRSGRIRIM